MYLIKIFREGEDFPSYVTDREWNTTIPDNALLFNTVEEAVINLLFRSFSLQTKRISIEKKED